MTNGGLIGRGNQGVDMQFGNIYGRVLPIGEQKDSTCVTCGHPHWDTISLRYVRCGMCPCENVGRNDVRLT